MAWPTNTMPWTKCRGNRPSRKLEPPTLMLTDRPWQAHNHSLLVPP